MLEHDLSPIEIARHRALTEARLFDFLEKAGSTETVDSIKDLIFDATQKDLNSYVRYLLWIFESPKSTVDIDAAVPVIQDAWNYFPHRFLKGRCPAEVISELS